MEEKFKIITKNLTTLLLLFSLVGLITLLVVTKKESSELNEIKILELINKCSNK